MKAIEILKECKSYAELWSVKPLSKDEQDWINDIDEAIAELVALEYSHESLKECIAELEADIIQRECLELDCTDMVFSLRERVAKLEALQDEVKELNYKSTILQSENDKLKLWLNAQESKNCESCDSYVNETCTDNKGHYCIYGKYMEDYYVEKEQ